MSRYIDLDEFLEDITGTLIFTVKAGKENVELRGAKKVLDRLKAFPTLHVYDTGKCGDCLRVFNEHLDMEISYKSDFIDCGNELQRGYARGYIDGLRFSKIVAQRNLPRRTVT